MPHAKRPTAPSMSPHKRARTALPQLQDTCTDTDTVPATAAAAAAAPASPAARLHVAQWRAERAERALAFAVLRDTEG